MIESPHNSGVTTANKNWHIVVDHYMGYKESEFYYTKSEFAEPMCKKFWEWKNNGKMVTQ